MSDTVEGEFMGEYSGIRGGFLYRYVCGVCGRVFIEIVPDVSYPAICEGCFHGRQEERRKSVRRSQKRRKKGKTCE